MQANQPRSPQPIKILQAGRHALSTARPSTNVPCALSRSTTRQAPVSPSKQMAACMREMDGWSRTTSAVGALLGRGAGRTCSDREHQLWTQK